MKHLIGKRFELTEVVECEDCDGLLSSVTLVGDDEVVRLEGTTPLDGEAHMCASIEQLSDPVSEEVKTDVFGGNFVAVDRV